MSQSCFEIVAWFDMAVELQAPSINGIKALTHYKDFHKDFSKKKSLGKSLSIYKTVEKIVVVVKKVVVYMKDI